MNPAVVRRGNIDTSNSVTGEKTPVVNLLIVDIVIHPDPVIASTTTNRWTVKYNLFRKGTNIVKTTPIILAKNKQERSIKILKKYIVQIVYRYFLFSKNPANNNNPTLKTVIAENIPGSMVDVVSDPESTKAFTKTKAINQYMYRFTSVRFLK